MWRWPQCCSTECVAVQGCVLDPTLLFLNRPLCLIFTVVYGFVLFFPLKERVANYSSNNLFCVSLLFKNLSKLFYLILPSHNIKQAVPFWGRQVYQLSSEACCFQTGTPTVRSFRSEPMRLFYFMVLINMHCCLEVPLVVHCTYCQGMFISKCCSEYAGTCGAGFLKPTNIAIFKVITFFPLFIAWENGILCNNLSWQK